MPVPSNPGRLTESTLDPRHPSQIIFLSESPAASVGHDEAAVDVERLAGDVGARRRGEEQDDAIEVVGALEPPERNMASKLEDLGAMVDMHRGVDDPGSNRVDPDAERSGLLRSAPGDGVKRGQDFPCGC